MAGDPVQVDSSHYSVELENEHVRVLRVRYGPGEKSTMHAHPGHLAVALTDSRIRMHLPDGSFEDMHLKAGEIIEAPAGDHLPENLAEEPMEVVVIEIKAAG